MSTALFELLHARGRAAVLGGEHQREDLPEKTGRWGHSLVSVLEGAAAASLGALTRKAIDYAGPGHWRSGTEGRAHVTIRALEPYSDDPPDQAVVGRAWSAFERVFTRPLHLALDGLLLAPAGVMVRCRDVDGAADALRAAYGRALGEGGWFEDAVFAAGRDPIWYCTIVHFVGPVAAPERLVDWVEERIHLDMGTVCLDTFSLCRWDLDGSGMAPTELRRRRLDRASD